MSIQTYNVLDTTYHYHTEPDGTSTMEVRYKIAADRYVSEYLNFETGHYKDHAAKWWQDRSPDPVPKINQHAVDSANYHALAITKRIEVYYQHFGSKVTIGDIGDKPASIDEIW